MHFADQTHVPESQGLYVGVYITARAMLNKGQRVKLINYTLKSCLLLGIFSQELDESTNVASKIAFHRLCETHSNP